MDSEKLIYDVEADPEASSSQLVDILRKVPQLEVDGEDNVILNGENNFKVLVNGRNSPMYSKNFKEVIKSIPASVIKQIEIITTPSSRYDAEGLGALLTFKPM